jgi:PAS domain S-box-containing protein
MTHSFQMYDHFPDPVHSIDRNGRLLYVNRAWLRSLGHPHQEVLGKQSTDFLTDRSQTMAEQIIYPEFFEKGYISNVPYEFIKKNGETIYLMLSGTLLTVQGQTCTLEISKDITELFKFITPINQTFRHLLSKPEELYRKLFLFRGQMQTTQEKMAEILGISVRTYQRLEQGSERLSLGQISRLCHHFGQSPLVFFFNL